MHRTVPLFIFLCTVMGSAGWATEFDNFCADAQQMIVRTALPVQNVVHDDYDAFVLSKPSIDPITTHQFFALREDGLAVNLSCKLKSPDHITDLDKSAQVSGNDCRTLHQYLVERAVDELRAEGQAVGFDEGRAVTFVEDEAAGMGPQWLSVYPYPALTQKDGKLQLQAKTMIVSWYSWAPMPARFKGTFYCHLAAPQYLKAVLSGQEVAPNR